MLRRLLRLRRKPDETNAEYNVRGATIIGMWPERFGVGMVWERVLKNVFKAAWDCKVGPFGLQE